MTLVVKVDIIDTGEVWMMTLVVKVDIANTILYCEGNTRVNILFC